MAKDDKEVKPQKAKDEWKVNLVVVDENQPPKKYIVKGEETLDESAALAKILNELEKLNEALLQ